MGSNRPHNTFISQVARWDWRLPPADRRNGEVKTYFLSEEELAKYRQGGAKKMEEIKISQSENKEKRSLKQVLEEDFASGRKSIEEIAEELGIRPNIVKAAAVRMGLIEKKHEAKNQTTDAAQEIVLTQVEFSGKFRYWYKDGKLTIRQDEKKKIALALEEIEPFVKDLFDVMRQISSLKYGVQ